MLLTINFKANNAKVRRVLEESKYKKYAKFIEGQYWLEEMSSRQMSEFALALKELGLDEEITPTLEYADTLTHVPRLEYGNAHGIDFEYDDLFKKIFLVERSMVWVYDGSIETAIEDLSEIADVEYGYGMSLMDFSDDLIEEAILTLYKGLKFSFLHAKVRIMSTYSAYYKGKASGKWSHYKKSSVLSEFVGAAQTTSEILTKGNLVNLFDTDPNPQYAIVPVLIFEGVVYSTIDDTDELRFIREEDIYHNGIFLRSGDKTSKGRFIELDSEVMSRVRITLAQERLYGSIRKQNSPEFEQTGYLLKPAGSRNIHSQMSYSGTRGRYEHFEENVAMIYGISETSTRYLQNYGKYHYINKFMREGSDLQDAIVKTLQRFNEYEFYSEENEKTRFTINENNRTRMNRLKSVWTAYGGLMTK